MIYFDNAATSFPKPKSVIKAVDECIKEYCGNPGRSSHRLAMKSSEKIFEAREEICELLNYNKPENIVFTLNATYALNMALKISIADGSHIIISDIEHNSVIRPLEALKNRGVTYDIICADGDVEAEVKKVLKPNTSHIVCSLASNVTGKRISQNTLYNIKQNYNLKLILDASQAIGHDGIDAEIPKFDILCAPSHKSLFGIQGSGFAVFGSDDEYQSFIEGGSGSHSVLSHMPHELPDRFEAGTLPTPSIVSLCEGIRFIKKIGIEEIHSHIRRLTLRTIEILNAFPQLEIFSEGDGIVSFRLKGVSSATVAERLNSHGIYVRSGLQCAPLIHKRLGTIKTGTVRLSYSYFNKMNELDKLYKVLKQII